MISKSNFKEELETELRHVFEVYANKLERGLSLLSGLGNLAPVVGFLGTVIGMIGAFSDIMLAASVNAKVVAGGIKVALVTTAGGLVVAAPTLAFFYFFMHMIQVKNARANELIGTLTEDKHSFLEINSEEQHV
jgi:biopolymer transport protein ExbB